MRIVRCTVGASVRLVLSFIFYYSTVGVHDIAQAAKPESSPTDLTGVTQNWDKTLPNESQFTTLDDFNNQAVRDNETGIVWVSLVRPRWHQCGQV